MKSILLIEDDSDIRTVYEEKLTAKGFNVILAIDAAEGLTLAKKAKPDLILLDIMLPGGQNGFDLLEILKKDDDLKAVPVIALTNLDTEKNTALQIGAVDYLIKANTSLDLLIDKVNSHLAT